MTKSFKKWKRYTAGMGVALFLAVSLPFSVMAEEAPAAAQEQTVETAAAEDAAGISLAEDEIRKIPPEADLKPEDAILVSRVREVFDRLTEEEQGKVENRDLLEKAEARLQALDTEQGYSYRTVMNVTEKDALLVISYADTVPQLQIISPDAEVYEIRTGSDAAAEESADSGADTEAEKEQTEEKEKASGETEEHNTAQVLQADVQDGRLQVHLADAVTGEWLLRSSEPVSYLVLKDPDAGKKQKEKETEATSEPASQKETETTASAASDGGGASVLTKITDYLKYIVPGAIGVVLIIGAILLVRTLKKIKKQKAERLAAEDSRNAEPSEYTETPHPKTAKSADAAAGLPSWTKEEEPEPSYYGPEKEEEGLSEIDRMRRELDAMWAKHEKEHPDISDTDRQEEQEQSQPAVSYITQEDIDNDVTIEEYIDEERDAEEEDTESERKRRSFFPSNRFD